MRVPHPLRNFGCDAKGGMNRISRDAQRAAQNPRRGFSLHYLQLLSPATLAEICASAQSLFGNPGAGEKEVSLHRRRLCGDARALPPPDERTRAGYAFDRHAGAEAACRTAPTAKETNARSQATGTVRRRLNNPILNVDP